ncbi:hypothetical protein D915_004637 [Fasciola hepatica]|uniref:Uncharacterized protein n=1 Tax=Fasciola hepatica TaxID=6192 RepID=A0A4E0REB2_FASHE|nr:hypothetical protein D915_004637 [Fasciola hepatica]
MHVLTVLESWKMSSFEVDELTSKISGKYEIKRNEMLKEIRSINDCIEGTEKAIQKNRQSYKKQMERTQKLRQVPLKKIRIIILDLSRSLHQVQTEIRKHVCWLHATRGWILLHTEFQRQKQECWLRRVHAMRQRINGIEASKEFTKLVFGGGPFSVLNKAVACSPKYLLHRRDQMESLLNQRSVDQIRQIEMNLRNRTSDRKEDIPILEPKPPLDSHPLRTHECRLLEAIGQLNSRERELQKQIEARIDEDKMLREKWRAVFKSIHEGFEETEKKYQKVLDEWKRKLHTLMTQVDQLNQEEKKELERETTKLHANKDKFAHLILQLDELTLGQSISPINHGSYFDYRPNYPLIIVCILFLVIRTEHTRSSQSVTFIDH